MAELTNHNKKIKNKKNNANNDNLAKRLIKDIKDVIKKPLTDNGIIYSHSDSNMLKGYAIIFGPKDTIYENGVYFFEFNFPEDYPYSPPTLKYLTNNGKTRFNPNLYRNGKVCISILNTWRGPGWTSCMSIRTVLITLTTLFHNKPLLNEPGVTEKHPSFKPYNEIIKYRNLETAIYKVMNQSILPPGFKTLWPLIKQHFKRNKKNIIDYIKNLSKSHETKTYKASMYGMTCTVDYDFIMKKIKDEYKNL